MSQHKTQLLLDLKALQDGAVQMERRLNQHDQETQTTDLSIFRRQLENEILDLKTQLCVRQEIISQIQRNIPVWKQMDQRTLKSSVQSVKQIQQTLRSKIEADELAYHKVIADLDIEETRIAEVRKQLDSLAIGTVQTALCYERAKMISEDRKAAQLRKVTRMRQEASGLRASLMTSSRGKQTVGMVSSSRESNLQ